MSSSRIHTKFVGIFIDIPYKNGRNNLKIVQTEDSKSKTKGMGMEKWILPRRRKPFVWAVFFLVPVLVATLWASVYSANRVETGRVDMLTLDPPSTAAAPKMPAVVFLHDKHTGALTDKGCKACHQKASEPGQPEGFQFGFKNTQALEPDAATKQFHAECTGCHRQMRDQDEKSGPLTGECRACHRPRPGISSAWQPVSFSKSLHFRHTEASTIRFKPQTEDSNCGACHHVYDEKLEKTVYKKGAEGSCRYCHMAVPRDETRSFRDAAHTDCVNCHQRLSEADKKAGPFDCAGCHSRKGQEKIEKIGDVPRMKRNQPDAVLMAEWLEEAGKNGALPKQRVRPVAFNHLKHEAATPSCRACHHASLEACRKCHTNSEPDKGGDVTLGSAMHAPSATESCVGCHDSAKQHKNCAGCHAQMPAQAFSGRDCRKCHEIDPQGLKPLPITAKEGAKIAAAAIDARAGAQEQVAQQDIPEKVTVDIMADVYQGATFPHRKIVQALAEKTRKSELAVAFHSGRPETLCMGCHHNSPASLTPPACVSCHNLKGADPDDGRPGLKAAYHGQCINCHQRMEIEEPAATDCTACHKIRPENEKTHSGSSNPR